MDIGSVFLDRLGNQGVDKADDRGIIVTFEQVFRFRYPYRALRNQAFYPLPRGRRTARSTRTTTSDRQPVVFQNQGYGTT